jgi:hypothetical protein
MPAPFVRRALVLLALLSPALASAQKPLPAAGGDTSKPAPDRQTAARGLALEGLKLFGADHYAEALATFREADALFHAPSVTLYIARCQRKMGKLLDARATYDRLLAEALPKDASPQFVQAHVEAGQELEGLKQKIPTLRVVVAGVPAGEAQVTLDGAPLAEGQKELDPGRYTVEARRTAVAGGSPVARAVSLIEGDHKTVTFDLGVGGSTSTEASRWYLPGAVTLGAGALVLGVGAVAGAVSLVKTNQIKSQCIGTMCPVALAGEAATAKNIGYVSTTGFAAGAAAVIAGGVLLYVYRPRAQAPAQEQAGWGLSVGVGRVDVEGRF